MSRQGFFLMLTAVMSAALTVGVAALLLNIRDRQAEGKHTVVRTVELTEDTLDPAIWGRDFPHQYDSYLRTVDTERTKHGGSEAFNKLDHDVRLRRWYAGYAFSIDFREERGHAYMLKDQDDTERVKQRKQPGACLHCHSSVMPAYREAGQGDVMKGFEVICSMDWKEARQKVSHPVTCVDCHDPKTAQVRVTRPGFLLGIKALAKSQDPVPHLPSIARWRAGNRARDYDPNRDASRQELRSFVCGQCHVEYYFKPGSALLTYPWHHGLKAEQMEQHYDDMGFQDWTHAESQAPLLKAQHPEFEMWSQGIHARSGVSCADCHMPYYRVGAMKVSDHHVRSPLLNMARACQTCHRYGEKEILARAELIQDRTKNLLTRAETAVVELIDAIQAGQKQAVPVAALNTARDFHRKAQWRVDFVAAENSLGFHAPQEAARLLGEAIDFARQGERALHAGK